ncbi:hypothetical protein [Ectothiorhodospira lacustris]|uniref:hypothetical protein n=1 Tax=Ectothiorhodospira lacustris TaxID=2899127 RepID=UPI001EE903EC|nr:hypothetical protein [Ectothiorhodospira lacustris]MCG5509620.1 hypothetical protein [Ectothiorhodospira lacustris]MCG5521585.1 hypothetical protein [Ectothiorhodospira lacustris]
MTHLTDAAIERQLLATADAIRAALPAMSRSTLDAVAAICLNLTQDATRHMTPVDARAVSGIARSLADGISRDLASREVRHD